MHVDLRYRHALRRRVDDVNRSMVCYFLSPWQLEVSESRYFTGTLALITFLGRGFRLAKRYVKENKAILKTVLRTKP